MAYKQRWAYFFEKMADKETGIVDFLDETFPRETFSTFFGKPPDSQEIQNSVVAYVRFWQGFIRHIDPTNVECKLSLSQMLAGVEKVYVNMSPDEIPWWFIENLKVTFANIDGSGIFPYEVCTNP
eukprot:Phypoly_transcript_17431.p1 GENE.Phypoly_transcript_17431~~Phypoly_transcript_17431.p1  ORF type:complete len:125 (-),score=14.10 Phypoly_transcript_17431:326-700(-)